MIRIISGGKRYEFNEYETEIILKHSVFFREIPDLGVDISIDFPGVEDYWIIYHDYDKIYPLSKTVNILTLLRFCHYVEDAYIFENAIREMRVSERTDPMFWFRKWNIKCHYTYEILRDKMIDNDYILPEINADGKENKFCRHRNNSDVEGKEEFIRYANSVFLPAESGPCSTLCLGKQCSACYELDGIDVGEDLFYDIVGNLCFGYFMYDIFGLSRPPFCPQYYSREQMQSIKFAKQTFRFARSSYKSRMGKESMKKIEEIGDIYLAYEIHIMRYRHINFNFNIFPEEISRDYLAYCHTLEMCGGYYYKIFRIMLLNKDLAGFDKYWGKEYLFLTDNSNKRWKEFHIDPQTEEKSRTLSYKQFPNCKILLIWKSSSELREVAGNKLKYKTQDMSCRARIANINRCFELFVYNQKMTDALMNYFAYEYLANAKLRKYICERARPYSLPYLTPNLIFIAGKVIDECPECDTFVKYDEYQVDIFGLLAEHRKPSPIKRFIRDMRKKGISEELEDCFTRYLAKLNKS